MNRNVRLPPSTSNVAPGKYKAQLQGRLCKDGAVEVIDLVWTLEDGRVLYDAIPMYESDGRHNDKAAVSVRRLAALGRLFGLELSATSSWGCFMNGGHAEIIVEARGVRYAADDPGADTCAAFATYDVTGLDHPFFTVPEWRMMRARILAAPPAERPGGVDGPWGRVSGATIDSAMLALLRNAGPPPGEDRKPLRALGDRELMRLGADLWTKTYKLGMNDVQARGLAGGAGWSDSRVGHFAAKWAVHAFQCVQTSHTFASALMCSTFDTSVFDNLQRNWGAWMVRVPTSMLVWDEGRREVTRILLAEYDDGAFMALIDPRSGRQECLEASNLCDLMTAPLPDATPEQGRVIELSRRLVVGLLLASQDSKACKERVVTAKCVGHRRDSEEPEHRIVTVGRPLTIDCRDAIGSFIRTGQGRRGGTRGLPRVQWITTGHWRNQPYGRGRGARKRIWIKPHWKGREGAPILAHTRNIVGPSDRTRGGGAA